MFFGFQGVAEPHFLHCTPIHALSVRYLVGVYTATPDSWGGKEHLALDLEIKDGIVVVQVLYLGAKSNSLSFA